MSIRGRRVKLNTGIQVMWKDEDSGLFLSALADGCEESQIPTDPSVNLDKVQKALNRGVLILIQESEKKSPKSKKPNKSKVPTIDLDPKRLIKYSVATLEKRIFPKITDPIILQNLLNLELNKSRSRSGLIKAIHKRLKALGMTETQIFQKGQEEPVSIRSYTKERGFAGEPADQPVGKVVLEEQRARRALSQDSRITK